MLFYSDLHVHNANAQPATVHADMLTLYAYQDELYYVNDANVHHKVITDQDLANPLAFAAGLLGLNYNTTNLKLTSLQLDTIQGISTAASPTFTSLTLSSTTFASLSILTNVNDTTGPAILLGKTRVTDYAFNGDTIGRIIFNSVNASGIEILVNAAENITSTKRGMTLKISSAAVGTSTLVERFSITSTGSIRFHNTYTFPAADGTSGQALITNGSGTISWSTTLDEKVKIKSAGTAGYLLDKLIAGTDITIAEGTAGNADKIVISATAGSSKWSTIAHPLGNYLMPTPPTYPHSILLDNTSNTLHSKIALQRQRAASASIQHNDLIGELEFLGSYASSLYKLGSIYSQFHIVSDTKYNTFYFKSSYFDASDNQIEFTCLQLNHEKAIFTAGQLTLWDQNIYRGSSNNFWLPSNAMASGKLLMSTSTDVSQWRTLSEAMTTAFSTPANGSFIYHNGTAWTAHHPSSAPANGQTIAWSASGPVWSPVTSFDKFKGFTTITSSRTLSLSDVGKVLISDDVADYELTVPEESSVNFPIGSVIFLQTLGSQTFNMAAAGAAWISARNGNINLSREYHMAMLYKYTSDGWIIIHFTQFYD